MLMGNVPLAFESHSLLCAGCFLSVTQPIGIRHFIAAANIAAGKRILIKTIAAMPVLPAWPQSMTRNANLLRLRLSGWHRR
jgi:hypothetical protein